MKQIAKFISISLAVSAFSIATYHFTIANKIKNISISREQLTNAQQAGYLLPSE